jgi:hypothetical protein
MGKRPRVGSVWMFCGSGYFERYVESVAPDGEVAYRAFDSAGVDLGVCSLSAEAFLDRCEPRSACPWEPESDAAPSPSAATGPSEAPTQNHSADEVQNEGAAKRNVVPATQQYMYGKDEPGPVVVVGMRVNLLAKGPGTVESVRHEGAWSSTVLFDNGQRQPMQLTREGRIHNTNSWTVIREPKPSPVPRCGQRYSDGRHEYAFLDEDGGTFLARRDDGLRVLVPRSRAVECAWRLVSGPTGVESFAEELGRVCRLERDWVPDGVAASEWSRTVDRRLSATTGSREWIGEDGGGALPKMTAAASFRADVRGLRGSRGPLWEGALTLEEAGR